MAVLVFSVGLIGLSSLLIMSFRSNQVAYQRTQAEFLAVSMADRMRANPQGVWAGGYYTATVSTSAVNSFAGQAYVMTAVPTGIQAKDACGSLTMTNAGVKSQTGTTTNGNCW